MRDRQARLVAWVSIAANLVLAALTVAFAVRLGSVVSPRPGPILAAEVAKAIADLEDQN